MYFRLDNNREIYLRKHKSINKYIIDSLGLQINEGEDSFKVGPVILNSSLRKDIQKRFSNDDVYSEEIKELAEYKGEVYYESDF